MSEGFQRTEADRLVLRIDDEERRILASLAHQLIEFVQPEDPDPDRDPLAVLVGIDDDAEISDDSALARMLPDAYPDDAEASRDFRRFTERSLREAKMANARTVIEALERSGVKVLVSQGESAAWLGFLNDTRLVFGSRIGITEDNHDDLATLPDDDPRLGLYYVYDWLTFLQETLVQGLLPDVPD